MLEKTDRVGMHDDFARRGGDIVRASCYLLKLWQIPNYGYTPRIGANGFQFTHPTYLFINLIKKVLSSIVLKL